ncbi:SET and MYND domain-containing protein 4 [Penaeus vannamei]|uniref:SET and MYND domain-containing protein 4 n=1 Tax=Penaeus vannamei TaxID=6689 RepID=A0A423TC19_PENVA|nr:SET and MYND domain-containing protein 4 [Penaeus vannamei]
MADAYEQLLRKIQAGLQQKMAGEQAAGEQEESLLIRATGVLDAIMEEFQEQRTDLERVQYVSQMSEIQTFSLKENYAQKSAEDATNYEKVYDMLVPNEASANKALDVIKKCLLKTPPEDTLALATRYMKRGWTYLLLEQFDNAKVDAMKSLSFKCPDEQMWNAYEILGHCYAMSKEYKEAEAQFLKALEYLRKSNISNEVKAATTVRIMSVFKTVKGKKQKKASSAAAEKPATRHVPQLSYGVNKRFPSASSAVNFVRSPMVGRCALAQRDIKPGDILIIDEPYVTMMNADVCGSHCYNCFSYCPCPIPCSSCAKVSYCSDSCYAASWEKQHKMECKVLNHLMDPEIGKVALLVFRALVMVSWSKLQKLKEKLLTVIDEEKCEAPNLVAEEVSTDYGNTDTPLSSTKVSTAILLFYIYSF